MITALLILTASSVAGSEYDFDGRGKVSIDSTLAPALPDSTSWSCCGSRSTSISLGNHNFSQQISDTGKSAAQSEFVLRDTEGLKRDTWYFMGSQVATIGILYLMPESISSWSDEQKDDYSMSVWWENVKNPEIDKDDHFINYALHPYWGAAYFVRARERGFSKWESFWYSTLLSTTYEFGAEALFEEPSIQDLIITPVFGAWLGDYFMTLRADIRAASVTRGYRTRKENWLWALTDPLGVINERLDRLFGRDVELGVQPYFHTIRTGQAAVIGGNYGRNNKISGVEFKLTW